MAINIHTDRKLESHLEWLSRHTQKTKTDVIKGLVMERYELLRMGFRFGALGGKKISLKKITKWLKDLDKDHDLD